MSGSRETRRLLRLRGWGRDGGIHGRIVNRKTPVAGKKAGTDCIAGMRRAAALYLTSRECVARDVAFLLLPREADEACAGDLMIFTRGAVFMVGFAMAKRRPGPALARTAGRIRDLGQSCRIIHAETPAHAVEQLARLLDEG
ncbi:MAG: hypothetical protein IMF08_11865 [Proteobacteria bacterium]|nr:hypothetical protein [Pseudomonadota bacterium]